MKYVSQGTYFESCTLAFGIFRKLKRWQPPPEIVSAQFKLISSTKTAIILLFGCCLCLLCACILLLFISDLLAAIQWHKVRTFAAPRACYTKYKQMISKNHYNRSADLSQPLICGWGFKESRHGFSDCQDLEFSYDPSEQMGTLARALSVHIL